MRREFEDRRDETGAKKEPRGMGWEEDGVCCVKVLAGEMDQDSPFQAGGPLQHQEEGAGWES